VCIACCTYGSHSSSFYQYIHSCITLKSVCAFLSIFVLNSHRLNDGLWLVGGASNTGCAVFKQLGFDDEELASTSYIIAYNNSKHIAQRTSAVSVVMQHVFTDVSTDI
jgi:hypothetical protein